MKGSTTCAILLKSVTINMLTDGIWGHPCKLCIQVSCNFLGRCGISYLLESKRRGYKSLSSNRAVTSAGLRRRGGMAYMMKGYNQGRQHF